MWDNFKSLRIGGYQLDLDRVYYENSIAQWLLAAAVVIGGALLLRLLVAIVRQRGRSVADRLSSRWAEGIVQLIDATRLWFLIALAAYVATESVLALPPRTMANVVIVARVLLLLQVAIWGSVLLTFGISQYVRDRMASDAAAVTTVAALGFVGKVALWSIIGLLILENVGVDVTALVAGLGVGGIAVALAAQNILGDLFASMSIVLDKPFVLGDFIAVGTEMGTVEHIGLKTTRIRSLSGEQLVFANNDLLQSRIRNYKRMTERRILFTVGATYQTPVEKVAAIPAMIREAVEAQPNVRFDRAHFKSLGDFALLYEVVYFVLVPEYAVYMDTQQAINLQLMRRFEQEQIDFAYPTQTIFLERGAAEPGASRAA